MGLASALVDQARVVERTAAGRRVEGRTLYGTQTGPWFACRLTLPVSPEQADAAAGIKVVVRAPELMYDVVDADGGDVRLTNQTRVEVDSVELGRTLWEVVADPEPLRKKTSVIGFQVSLRRLEAHPADEVAA